MLEITCRQDNLLALIQMPFPMTPAPTKCETVKAIVDEILGSKKYRNGAKPSDEAQAVIHKMVSGFVNAGLPIRFLVPWGSEKPVWGQSVDLAELSAMKTMVCLNERISRHYAPGATFYVRVEDASAFYMFRQFGETAFASTRQYTNDFVMLAKVLGIDNVVKPIPETSVYKTEDFARQIEPLVPAFIGHLHRSAAGTFANASADPELVKVGWQGVIAPEMQAYYIERFSRLFPELDNAHHVELLAEYFAGALVRRALMKPFMQEYLPEYLTLYFDASPPGAPKQFMQSRINYRTLPLDMTSNHLPAWRAKGYVEVSSDGQATLKVASWRDLSKRYIRQTLSLVNGPHHVQVAADLHVEAA